MTALPILRPELLMALVLFAFASSITPGPNNLMLMASGTNFGWRRTLPHWCGIVAGFTVLLLACGLGLGGLFTAYPVLHEVLKWAGAAYLVYLAIKIATSTSLKAKDGAAGRPMTFLQGAAFQFVNVKAFAMAVTAATTYIPAEHYVGNLLVLIVVFIFVNAPSQLVWLSFGVVLKQFLEKPANLRAFNILMALLLIASLYPLFL